MWVQWSVATVMYSRWAAAPCASWWRFGLTPNHKESDYRMLGEELTKRGGFWQVDLGSIATVNIPTDFEFDVDQIIKELDLKLVEITE